MSICVHSRFYKTGSVQNIKIRRERSESTRIYTKLRERVSQRLRRSPRIINHFSGSIETTNFSIYTDIGRFWTRIMRCLVYIA